MRKLQGVVNDPGVLPGLHSENPAFRESIDCVHVKIVMGKITPPGITYPNKHTEQNLVPGRGD